MEQLLLQLRGALSGTVSSSPGTRASVRRDGSLFEITPDAVVLPATVDDVKKLVTFLTAHKAHFPTLSLTPRGAGTDMSGAAIGSSIILDTASLSAIHAFNGRTIKAQPGVRLYDLHRILSAHGATLGSLPSSYELTTLGGMVANNSAGADSYRYGATQQWIRSLQVVLADGNEYTVRPLTKQELDKKMREPTYEGRLYAHLYSLLNRHYDVIRNARPHTTKNTSGYNIWDVWDREAGRFDLTQLFAGSQGTLGVITSATLGIVAAPSHTGTLLVRMRTLRDLDELLSIARTYAPRSIEGFDDVSLVQALQARSTLTRQIGKREYAKQQAALLTSRTSLTPHNSEYILLITLDGATEDAVAQQLEALYQSVRHLRVEFDIVAGTEMQRSVGRITASTLSLIQSQIKTVHASPFIDDVIVHPSKSAAFLPRLRKILKKHSLPATIHGHFGDGNFHILPLIDVSTPKQQQKLEPLLRDISKLVLEFDGSLSGEHGDGMLRGPWLQAQFSQEIYQLFKEVKELFDPLYIFNPHKKTDASWEYSMSHLRSKDRK